MILLVTSLTILFFDQISKYFAQYYLTRSIPIIPHVFHLTLVRNSGGAFGLFSGWTFFFISVGVLTIALIAIYWRPIQESHWKIRWSIALILGGTVGNMVDRVRCGYVIDFLDFRVWPVFNIADSCITVGTCLLIWSLSKTHVARSS